MKLGILDLGQRDNKNSIETIFDIIQYAQYAEEINCHRFWLAEHHPKYSLQPYLNPEILMSIICCNTETIRIGSGGALIGYHSPYLIASNYKFLNNIFNDRIDLGFSKGRPENSNQHNYFRTAPNKKHIELFRENMMDICDLFYKEEDNFTEKGITIPPYNGFSPSLWYLSNSFKDKQIGIDLMLNYCISLFHGLQQSLVDKSEIIDYKESYYKKNNNYPEVALAIAVSFNKTLEDIDKSNKESINISEAFNIIPLKDVSFLDVIKKMKLKYNMEEIIVYDTEINNIKKLENLKKIKDCIDEFNAL